MQKYGKRRNRRYYAEDPKQSILHRSPPAVGM
jgi:hypothetical protein